MKIIPQVFLVGASVFSACKGVSSKDYMDTLRSGRSTIPWVAFVDHTFDPASVDHFITHYAFDRSRPCEWQTVVYFNGRYKMQIVQKVVIDYHRNIIERTDGEMSIVINEITQIAPDLGASYGEQVRFGKETWEKFEKSGGDYKVLPMTIRNDAPLPLFQEYRKSWGKDVLR